MHVLIIHSLCPVNSSVPIEANGIIPISESDVASFPSIALNIPDFEGEAILRIFANSTESEIGCYSAVVTNGHTFSHPRAVGTVLGIFTFVALLASFATAIYGGAVPTMRLHYAHSLSVGVVFAVFQHIFFTGALSVNWPSVLVAWWSNFAWAGGMIYSPVMQASINHLIGNNVGNTSQVGAAPSGSTQESLGGGYDISQIYKRFLGSGIKRAVHHRSTHDLVSEIYKRDPAILLRRDIVQKNFEHVLSRRDGLVNASSGYKWYGQPVVDGLPLPGNYSGFAGTLAAENIRVSNAFMTLFLWFLILLVLLVGAVMAFKWIVEGLVRMKTIKEDRLEYFRQHWLGYSGSAALRICYLAWFAIMMLAVFQFTYQSSVAVKVIAAVVFFLFLIALPAITLYSFHYKTKFSDYNSRSDGYVVERKRLLGAIPYFVVKKPEAGMESQAYGEQFPSEKGISGPSADLESRNIHDDEDYTKKFGWLAARFRRTRWWFSAFWLLYEFIRACFYGGASGNSLAQVFGLLIVEIVAVGFLIWARPFEGTRLNILVVYCLGFSKVTSVGLSAAFDVKFNLPRIITTVIGVVIIVIQGILTIITLIAIVVGAISSYMSVSRNREEFKPKSWHGLRERYFNHLDRAVNDLPPEPKPKPEPKPEPTEPSPPYFEMKGVRRLAKIEDEDREFATEMAGYQDPAASHLSLNERSPTPMAMENMPGSGAGTPVRRSRAASLQSMSGTNLPFGARAHRPSWSQRDLAASWNRDSYNERALSPVDMSHDIPDDEPTGVPSAAKGAHGRTKSRSSTMPSAAMRAQQSVDSLQIGGEPSTRDSIGRVPAPSVRPRAGTYGSRIGSRSATPSYIEGGGIDSAMLGD